MAYYPKDDPNFASLTFAPALIYGDTPVLMQFQLDLLPVTADNTYGGGTLLAQGSDPAHLVIYDSTATPAQNFKGIFYDETATPEDIVEGFVDVAVNDRLSTMWLYDALVGANAGTVDIDALIAAGVANVIYQYENGKQIKLVQFKGMGVGA